jgi:5-methyltetrahydrofolate--homocysteine methyltransferase
LKGVTLDKAAINKLLDQQILILDGATGTELQKRGMSAGTCPELWSLENPAVLESVHEDYIKAGSDIIYTCTFGANEYKLKQYGRTDIREINRNLAMLARKVSGDRTLVAGDIGPTGQFFEPFGGLPFEKAIEIFKEQAKGLLDGGVDLFVIETMMDIQEARAALIAIKEISDSFTIVTMTYEKDGRTLNGTDAISALITLQSLGADAVGCNCSSGPDTMLKMISSMKRYAKVPLAAKPNAGIPKLIEGKTVFDLDPSPFAAFGKKFVADGTNLMGGCCGTDPRHIAALKQVIGNDRPYMPLQRSIAALSSARGHIVLESRTPLVVVGERINPTGKKVLREALAQDIASSRHPLIREMARDQEKQGAQLLDVNVGVPGIDETAIMREVIGFLAKTTDLPLVIDSPNIDAIEAALRLYPGRALINSISAEKKKMKRLLPVAAKYGAMFILLPLTEREVPETATVRKRIIRRVLNAAKAFGFTQEDIIVDGLVMTVAANAGAALETLDTIEWCANKLKMRTILGLSNVSFGMPERKWINAAFLAMACAKGLTMTIANPSHEELMNIKFAADALSLKDKGARFYIERFSGAEAQSGRQGKETGPESEQQSPARKIYQAILDGNREEITILIDQALTCDISAFDLVNTFMIPAITAVGNLFEKRTYFLPQLIAGAETMKIGIDHLEPCLRAEKAVRNEGKVLLATVEGDIHDIGKNIIALILRNHGYEVIDLGKDISADRIISEAQHHQPVAVGLSALMTTTMQKMRETIELAQKRNVRCPFLIGGAVVTKEYAHAIGAHFAKDGVEAVHIIRSFKSKES